MGRNLLRRKAVAVLLCLGLWGAYAAGRAAAADPPGADPAGALPVVGPGPALPRDPPDDAADRDPGGAVSAFLPPLQGHQGEELYSLAIPDESIIDVFLKSYMTTKREWLQAVLDRMPLYRGVIVAEIAELGLPRELLFLPAVESGFQIGARSPRGAAGLWQLMRNTASPFGLVTDAWVDERLDFWKATEASLKKLAEDYRRFGDWYLALAAYNCGSTRLAQAVGEGGEADFWTLRRKGLLPRETSSFVPQFLALARILSYPGRYGLAPSWSPTVSWTRVPVSRSVDLGLLSRKSGVPLDTLLKGNAELTMALTPSPSYRYMLKVPVEYRQSIEATLADGSLPLIDFLVYLVKAGDTLSGIARSYGVTVALLEELNPSARPLALRIGSRLLIPKKGRSG